MGEVFKFRHKQTKELKTIDLTKKQIQELLKDTLYDMIMECDCESIGETNVIECNCEEYLQHFILEEIK